MPLIFDNCGPNLGKFPDLMAERFDIQAMKRLAATSTVTGQTGHDLRALFHRQQRSLIFGMSRLAALGSRRLGLRGRRLGMGVNRRRGLGRIGRGFATGEGFKLGLQLRNTRGQLRHLSHQLLDDSVALPTSLASRHVHANKDSKLEATAA